MAPVDAPNTPHIHSLLLHRCPGFQHTNKDWRIVELPCAKGAPTVEDGLLKQLFEALPRIQSTGPQRILHGRKLRSLYGRKGPVLLVFWLNKFYERPVCVSVGRTRICRIHYWWLTVCGLPSLSSSKHLLFEWCPFAPVLERGRSRGPLCVPITRRGSAPLADGPARDKVGESEPPHGRRRPLHLQPSHPAI